MASITQTIPNYHGGISQQPDELKLPGQVTEAKNVLPDLVEGLMKRPGGKLVAPLSEGKNSDNSTRNKLSFANGKWFHYYRDEDEQYIGQISRDGVARMWKCSNGDEKTVHIGAKPWVASTAYVVGDQVVNDSGKIYQCDTAGTSAGSGGPSGTGSDISDGSARWDYYSTQALVTSYITHSNDEDIQTLTLNDYTYITNRTKTVAMSGTLEVARPYEAYIELKKTSYASQYALNIFNDNSTVPVFSAARISIDTIVNSANSCKYDTNDTPKWTYPSSGTEPGQGIYTNHCTANNGDQDGYCPNVATKIFSIDHGDAVNSADINGVTGRTVAVGYTVANGTAYVVGNTISNSGQVYRCSTAGTSNGTAPTHTSGTQTVGGVGWEHYGTQAERKKLYFRVTVTGQAVPESSDTAPDYHCRYTTIVDLLYGGEGWRTGDTFEIWLKNAKYRINIDSHNISYQQANLGLIRPTPTPFDAQTAITAESILGDIQDGILNAKKSDGNNSNWYNATSDVRIIGNGIYITDAANFNITSPTGDLLNVITSECNNIEDLPTQCLDGYVVKVKNSEANEDDYYVRFFGENGRDGPGTWEECAAPERKIEIDKSTMPLELVRQGDGSFILSDIVWDKCLVGNTTTVPEPSFVGKEINKMVFWRNRMIMLSDENVIMSQPGDFYNFWPRSAITYTATDVIDLSCSSEYPAIVQDAIQTNSGLVLFTKNKQFLLTTDSDVLSPQTAKINSLSSYNFNSKTNPISLGTTIGFLDNAGKHSRFWEAANILREGEPIVIDQTKVVNKIFNKNLTLISNSRENGIILFSEKDTNTIYGYRYFNVSDNRLQQAWFTWELMGKVQHHAVLDDAFYAVVRNDDKDVLQKFFIKKDSNEPEVVDDLNTTDTSDDITYRVHLDNSKEIESTELTYDATNNWTKFNLPDGFDNASGKLAVYALPGSSDDTFQGSFVEQVTGDGFDEAVHLSTFVESGVTKVKLPGNWETYLDDQNTPKTPNDPTDDTTITPAYNLILGYQFDMEVKFPTIYFGQQSGQSYRAALNGSLIIHRVKLNFGANGLYKTTIDRTGKPSYTEEWEPTMTDQYSANQVQFNEQASRTIPTYEKNKNLTLTLKSTHPSPATLYSMTWEGDYTTQNYRSV